MMTDPIADMLTRIRNATMAHHDRCELPHSKLKEHVAGVLKSEGYIDDVRVGAEEPRPVGLPQSQQNLSRSFSSIPHLVQNIASPRPSS